MRVDHRGRDLSDEVVEESDLKEVNLIVCNNSSSEQLLPKMMEIAEKLAQDYAEPVLKSAMVA